MTEYETVTVKASLDAQGNGAFPSDTNIITHDGIPLRDYLIAENEHTLKKPEGRNELGTIIVPENTDARTLKKDGVYYCYQWLPESVPENSHALAIRVVNSKNGSRALYADLTASPLVYRAFVSGEVFYDWELNTEMHTNVTFMNGWVVNGHEPLLTKIGNIVWFNGIVRNGINTAGTTICTIPAGFRPYYVINAAAITSAGNGLVNIGRDGTVKFAIIAPDKTNVQITSMWKVKW